MRVDGLRYDMQQLKRQRPVRFAPLIWSVCAVAALCSAKVGLDHGRVWEILLAFTLFAGWSLKAIQTWQDSMEWSARNKS